MSDTLIFTQDSNLKQEAILHTQFVIPTDEDAVCINELVAASPPLDPNSIYCNLLQCTHFADTSICARQGDQLLGFISAYKIPKQPTTLFIWQVAVATSSRGKGLAGQMLNSLLRRPTCRDIAYLETTVTESNHSSLAFFNKFAQKLETNIDIDIGFEKEKHFQNRHEAENLVRIGPFILL